jgi:IS1 family transposase
MANILAKDKQIAVIGALAEGTSIRSIERLTGIHRDTIMRLGVKIGERCARLMDGTMRNLNADKIQVDEIWGYVGKKQKNAKFADMRKGLGDVWTWIAVDADSRMVASFLVGKRDNYHARTFVEDLASRLSHRVQISSDALASYIDAVERGFGSEVDYGQIVKTFTSTDLAEQRRYSPPDILQVRRTVIKGNPERRSISTSYVERQNLTVRMHCRRLARLTNAFSKKLDNFKAAVALHFAYYNFVRIHKSLRMTPAMAAGVTDRIWTIADLLES